MMSLDSFQSTLPALFQCQIIYSITRMDFEFIQSRKTFRRETSMKAADTTTLTYHTHTFQIIKTMVASMADYSLATPLRGERRKGLVTLPVKTLPYAGICASQSDCPTHVLQPQSHACHMMQSKMAFNAKRRRVVDVDKGIHESIRRLGYENVKDHQRKVIESFVEGNDVFAVLPTGYGKSLCYFCLRLTSPIPLSA